MKAPVAESERAAARTLGQQLGPATGVWNSSEIATIGARNVRVMSKARLIPPWFSSGPKKQGTFR